ncbi:hypothetical protein KFL_002920040 [Klebsormidium nitens]|uniref:OTU domain-containing protein n=1 Tax=Klebsormidium nitens TaxID=105231 RepID=A0A1Y1ICM9_KLENI|nr:hypothetical protein KFL_002920040 [Klebsormidium nitens]|eukprot:GAQ86487.1 hypothetical protein KFL_002920040 [Klebsormidium nitens]
MAKKKVQTQVKVAKGTKAAAAAREKDSPSTPEVVVGKNAERKRREAIRRAKEKLKGGSDIALFREQLRVIGLKIQEVTADGNCFFRAIADQLEGDAGDHVAYRERVVEYMAAHEADFAPFVEDDVPLEKYLQEMREDGTWAGNMELQAASLVTRANICIHRVQSPRWHIRNFDVAETRTIHLSYHDGEHYNSVRREDDPGGGPALPIHVEGDAQLKGPPTAQKKSTATPRGRSSFREEDVTRVIASTPCRDEERIRQVLLDLAGDVDAVIEFLIAEGSSESALANGIAEDGVFSERPAEALATMHEGAPLASKSLEPASPTDACTLDIGRQGEDSGNGETASTSGAEKQPAARNKAVESRSDQASFRGVESSKETIAKAR